PPAQPPWLYSLPHCVHRRYDRSVEWWSVVSSGEKKAHSELTTDHCSTLAVILVAPWTREALMKSRLACLCTVAFASAGIVLGAPLASRPGGAVGLAFQAPASADVFTDPDKAGPDFAVQGEYEGALDGGERLAAQVVAEGKGTFAFAFFKG